MIVSGRPFAAHTNASDVPVTVSFPDLGGASSGITQFARLYDRYIGPKLLSQPENRKLWMRIHNIPDSELWRTKERMRERRQARKQKRAAE